jgi:hypothetical protein
MPWDAEFIAPQHIPQVRTEGCAQHETGGQTPPASPGGIIPHVGECLTAPSMSGEIYGVYYE